MTQAVQDIRVVSSTVRNGRVSFNQVVLSQSPPPAGVLLVAIDAIAGLYIWLKPHAVVAAHARTQAPGYSEQIRPFDIAAPPGFLGPGVFIDTSKIDAALWTEITQARTKALQKAVARLFSL